MKNKVKDLQKTINSNNKLANFLFEVGTLRKISRSHRQILFTHDDSDNIASHSYRVIVIGYFLALQESVDIEKVMLMCTFHDVEETRTGDQNWAHKKYVKVDANAIIKDQIEMLPQSKDLAAIIREYNERKSLEAIVAKDADLIDQVLLLKEYERAGNLEATAWLEDKKDPRYVKTKSAKRLLKEIHESNPGQWWYPTGTHKR